MKILKDKIDTLKKSLRVTRSELRKEKKLNRSLKNMMNKFLNKDQIDFLMSKSSNRRGYKWDMKTIKKV